MNDEQQTSAGQELVTLQGSCTVERAEELKNSLLSQLQSGSELRMDLSAVTGCDLTFLQLICAVSKKAEFQGTNIVSISNIPQNIVDLVKRIDLYYSCSQCWTQSCILKEVSSYE